MPKEIITGISWQQHRLGTLPRIYLIKLPRCCWGCAFAYIDIPEFKDIEILNDDTLDFHNLGLLIVLGFDPSIKNKFSSLSLPPTSIQRSFVFNSAGQLEMELINLIPSWYCYGRENYEDPEGPWSLPDWIPDWCSDEEIREIELIDRLCEGESLINYLIRMSSEPPNKNKPYCFRGSKYPLNKS